MEWLYYVSYFFGGAFLANTIPHLAAGMMGQAFQSPFARPPGKGLSSSTVNVIWGMFNLVVAYFLILKVGPFDMRNGFDVTAVFVGALVIALQTSRHFGQFHGGNLSQPKE